MRSFRFRVCGLCFPAGCADGVRNFPFARRQRIVSNVQRAVLDSDIDHTFERRDDVGYSLFARRIADWFDFELGGHRFSQVGIRVLRFIVHISKEVFARRAITSCIRRGFRAEFYIRRATS